MRSQPCSCACGLRQETLPRGKAVTLSSRDGRKRSPFLGGPPPGMNTAANEQTEPEELKENEGRRKGRADGQARGKAASSGGPHPCPQAQKPLPGPKARASLAHRSGEGALISLPTPGLTAKRLGRSSHRAIFKSPSSSGWARALGFWRVAQCHILTIRTLRKWRIPSDQGPQTQGQGLLDALSHQACT